jgi:NADH-quinone oxidoreductase subunit G
VLGHRLRYDTLMQVRRRLVEVNPIFAKTGEVVRTATLEPAGIAGTIDPAPFQSPITNFYLTDPISRCSPTMAQCREAALAALGEASTGKTGTHG